MKRLYTAIMLAAMLMIASVGCSDSSNNVWDDLPSSIEQFMARYFPGRAVSRFEAVADGYTLTVKNGPTIDFDQSRQWTALNGNGETLPPVFLFDQLPPALYSYLQDTNTVDGVYKATRAGDTYELTLEQTIVRYNTTTGLMTFPYD